MPSDLNKVFVDLGVLGIKVRDFLAQMNEQSTHTVLKDLGTALKYVCDNNMTHESIVASPPNIEKLKLYGASLSTDNGLRQSTLDVSAFIDAFVGCAMAYNEWTQLAPDSRDIALKKLIHHGKALNGFDTSLESTVNTLVNTIQVLNDDCPSVQQITGCSKKLVGLCNSSEREWLSDAAPWC